MFCCIWLIYQSENAQLECKHFEGVNDKFHKITIYVVISCYTEERIAQNIYIHNLKEITEELAKYL